MLGVESEVPGAQGGEPHFFAVGSYNLQHPSTFVTAALVGLAPHGVGRARGTGDDRRRPPACRTGRGRCDPRATRPGVAALRTLEERLRRSWPNAVAAHRAQYVIDGGTAEYVARVRELAQSVVATLEPPSAHRAPEGAAEAPRRRESSGTEVP